MLKGVPLDVEAYYVEQAICAKYPNTKCYRLFKDSNPLHALKVNFSNNTGLSDALESGVLVTDHIMKFKRERPYAAVPNNKNNG